MIFNLQTHCTFKISLYAYLPHTLPVAITANHLSQNNPHTNTHTNNTPLIHCQPHSILDPRPNQTWLILINSIQNLLSGARSSHTAAKAKNHSILESNNFLQVASQELPSAEPPCILPLPLTRTPSEEFLSRKFSLLVLMPHVYCC